MIQLVDTFVFTIKTEIWNSVSKASVWFVGHSMGNGGEGGCVQTAEVKKQKIWGEKWNQCQKYVSLKLLVDAEDARLVLKSPERVGERRRFAKCCSSDVSPHVKPFPVLSFPRSLDWPASRATRWRPWRGWNTHCPTYRVCSPQQQKQGKSAGRREEGNKTSLFLTVAISGKEKTHPGSGAFSPQNIRLQHIVHYLLLFMHGLIYKLNIFFTFGAWLNILIMYCPEVVPPQTFKA